VSLSNPGWSEVDFYGFVALLPSQKFLHLCLVLVHSSYGKTDSSKHWGQKSVVKEDGNAVSGSWAACQGLALASCEGGPVTVARVKYHFCGLSTPLKELVLFYCSGFAVLLVSRVCDTWPSAVGLGMLVCQKLQLELAPGLPWVGFLCVPPGSYVFQMWRQTGWLSLQTVKQLHSTQASFP
jgi:hypothetical protein